MSFYFSLSMEASFEEGISKVTEALKKEGFGILTEIDVQETLKRKLGVEFRKYRILGACNPPFAYEALQAEDKIGMLLPCNVIVQEHEPGRIEVSAIDPLKAMEVVGNPKLKAIAERVHSKLKRTIEGLSS
jgi:uncharacterized protein (DUF302 family)